MSEGKRIRGYDIPKSMLVYTQRKEKRLKGGLTAS